jgi:hypothetical protein
MIIPAGDYRYEIRRGRELVAIEETRLNDSKIVATRVTGNGLSRHEVEAVIDPAGFVRTVSVRYSSSLFKRNASYEADEDNLRGSISALAGRNEIMVQLGRFREIDAVGLILFRALIIAHIRSRNQSRWTGRVGVIDPNTLVAAAIKQNCRSCDATGRLWTYEPRMGDFEEIELDDAGRIVRRRDNRGSESVLLSCAAAT